MKYLEKNKDIFKYQFGGQKPEDIFSQGVQGLDYGVSVPQNPYIGAFNIPPMGNFGNGNVQQGQNDWSTNDPIYDELSRKDPRNLTSSEKQYLNDRAQSYNPTGQSSFISGNPPINGDQGSNYGWSDEQVKEYQRREAEKVREAMGGGSPAGSGYVNDKGQLVGGEKYQKDQNGQFVNAMKDYSRLGLFGEQDMNSTAYNLGRFIGAPKGTKGKIAGTVAAGLSLALKGARGVAAGMGHANLQKEADAWYREQMAKRRYVADSQWEDNNSMGGGTNKYGGTHKTNHYKDGGEKGGPDMSGLDESLIAYASMTPEEKEKAIKSYEEFTGRPIANDTFNITENQLEAFRNGEPVKGYWGEGKKPYVEQRAHFIIPEKGAKPIWVSRNEYENFKGTKSVASLDESGYPLVGATGGRRMDPNSYQDMRDKQLGNFSRGDEPKLNTLDLKGRVFQDGGEQQGDQMQQVLQMADQMFQQGAQPIEVASQLIQQGVPPEAIPQIFSQLGIPEEDIQLVMDQIMQSQVPQQRYGGLFEDGGSKDQNTNPMYRIGEPVEFEYGGKMVKGTIKKVENGKIYI